MKMSGCFILIAAWIYSRIMTQYFGNHWTPQSAEEGICDGITLLICAIGLLMMNLERKSK